MHPISACFCIYQYFYRLTIEYVGKICKSRSPEKIQNFKAHKKRLRRKTLITTQPHTSYYHVPAIGTPYHVMFCLCAMNCGGGPLTNVWQEVFCHPMVEMRRNWDSSRILMRRPSTAMRCSWAKVVKVRMAFEVVMFERLARSSRLIYILSVMPSSSRP